MHNSKFLKAGTFTFLMVTAGSLLPIANAQTGPGMGTSGSKGEMNKPMPMMMGSGTDKGMEKGMEKSMDMKPMMMDMQQKMTAIKSSGNVDTDFAMMMRVHHQSAITMAEAELQNGKDPQMRVMAKDIIRAQKNEIAAFDKFLAKRGAADMKMGNSGMQMKK